MARRPRQQQRASSSNQGTRNAQGTRNRASSSRIVKLYSKMTKAQFKEIDEIGFGGLLNIKCDKLPSKLANWLMKDYYDAETSQLVLAGRGVIKVTAEAVQSMMDLPNQGDEVIYALDVNAINFIQQQYNIPGSAPKISEIVKRVQTNRRANDDFVRSWLMLAISTFLCPPTSLGISPRFYPSVRDLSKVKSLNWCQLVVDMLKTAGSKIGKVQSFKGCLLFLVILYVDSLVVDNVDIPATTPRIAAWSRSLIDQVLKMDTNRDGSFGKLKLKSSPHTAVQTSLFQLDDVRRFVSSKVSSNMSNQKKRKLTTAVNDFCAGFTDLMGTVLEKVSKIEEPSSTSNSQGDGDAFENYPPVSEQRQTRFSKRKQAPQVEEDEEDGADGSDEEEDEDYGGTDEEEDEDDGSYDEDDGDDREANAPDSLQEDSDPLEGDPIDSAAPNDSAAHNAASNDSDDREEEKAPDPLEEESDPLPDAPNDSNPLKEDDNDPEFPESDAAREHGTPPLDFDDPADGMFTAHISEDEHSSLDEEPLIERLKRMHKGSESPKADETLVQPLAFILPENFKKSGDAHSRKLKLRLPTNPVQQKDIVHGVATATSVPNVGEGCSSFKAPAENIGQHETRSAAYKDPLDFTPPSFNLIDESDLL